MNSRRVARRVVSCRLPQNPWTCTPFSPTSATKLFRRIASKGTILGPGPWLLDGDGKRLEGVGGSSGRGVGVWPRAWCRGARRVAFAPTRLPSLFPCFIWARKERSVKGAS
jgi:hypothetical protein